MKFIESRMEQRGQSGFTLIELLVVIAILAVLGGAVIIGIGAMRGNAEEEVCNTNEETVNLAIKAYEVSEGSTPSMAQLIAGTDPYLDEVPGDWTVAGGVASSTECNLP